MKRATRVAILVLLVCGLGAWISAHDPRTTAKDFSHALTIEGAGKMELKYKSMHWNEEAYKRLQTDEAIRKRVNTVVWNNIGTLDLGFDITLGGQALAKGAYPFGLNVEPAGQFSLAVKVGNDLKVLPLEVSDSAEQVDFLTFAIYPTAKTDVFTLEGRGGKFRGKTSVTVPYLAEHTEKKPHQ